jgi:hypothetical protein
MKVEAPPGNVVNPQKMINWEEPAAAAELLENRVGCDGG